MFSGIQKGKRLMTDRIVSLTVTLRGPMRIDDVQSVVDAIKMLRHVENAVPKVMDPDAYWAEERARTKLGRKLLAIVYPGMFPDYDEED